MRQQGGGRWTPRADAEARVRDPRSRLVTRAVFSPDLSLALPVPVGRVSVYASEMSLVRERALSERTPPPGTLVLTVCLARGRAETEFCRGPAAAESRGSRRCYEASAMGDRRHHASEDSEALFRLLQAQMDFYIFLFGID